MKSFLVELNGKTWFSLSEKTIHKLGRDAEQVSLALQDDSVSRIHAQLSFLEDGWWLEDLGSEDGTYFGGTALQPAEKKRLVAGQRISIGLVEFVYIEREPLGIVKNEQAPVISTLEKGACLPPLEGKDCLFFMLQEISGLLDLKLDTSGFLEQTLDLIERMFAPEACVLALEDEVHPRGIEINDGFAELVLREARFQMKPLAYRSLLQSERSDFQAFYAPIFLEDLARGYLYILSNETSGWGAQEFQLFSHLATFVGRGLTSFQALRRAREDREVLHLNLVGIAPEMEALKIELLRVARHKAPVLVQGEEGVGKSRIARAIHQASPRRQAPLTVLKANNFPKELFETTICGSFDTDVEGVEKLRPGKVELAQGGSFLIEEIGDVPLGVQPTLLALINSCKVTPLGSEEATKVDVRIIATTTMPVVELKSQGRLIPELADIFESNELKVPPLRNRKEDIPQLFRAFLGRFGEEEGLPTCVVSDEALSLLKNHRWNLNIRELRRVVSACFHELDPDKPIVDEQLISKILEQTHDSSAKSAGPGLLELELMKVEHRVIQESLMAANDDMVEAAKALGISLVVLRRRMRELGIG